MAEARKRPPQSSELYNPYSNSVSDGPVLSPLVRPGLSGPRENNLHPGPFEIIVLAGRPGVVYIA